MSQNKMIRVRIEDEKLKQLDDAVALHTGGEGNRSMVIRNLIDSYIKYTRSTDG